MAKDPTEWWLPTLCRLPAFEALTPDTGYFGPNGERRICFMATPSDRDSTLIWHRSRASGGSGECVEVASSHSLVLVRDSRDRYGTRLGFSPAQWQEFVRLVKDEKAVTH